jgi:hypothetical protein
MKYCADTTLLAVLLDASVIRSIIGRLFPNRSRHMRHFPADRGAPFLLG